MKKMVPGWNLGGTTRVWEGSEHNGFNREKAGKQVRLKPE